MAIIMARRRVVDFAEVPSPSSIVPVRAVSALSLTAISVNTIIGAGIFALPATVAAILGPASPLAYLTAGTAVLLIALCFAEAGSRFESSGGPYVYARAAFGDFVGFEVGWMFVLARLTAVAAVSNTFADYMGYFLPAIGRGGGRLVAITLMIGALTAVHVAGVRLGVAVNNILTIGKLLPLLAFCVAGLFLLDVQTVFATPLLTAGSMQQASLLLLFAMGGFENASIPSEEVIDPRKSLPIALLTSVGSIVVLYLVIQVVAMAALPGLAASTTPLASAARNFLGPAGGIMMTVGAALSTAGSNHVNIFAGPRLLYALGRDGHLPARFAWLHPQFRTPVFSILLYSVTAWILAVSSAFGPLAALSALARLLVYTSTCAAVPVLRRRARSTPSKFTLRGGDSIPVLALVACAWLLTGSTSRQAIVGGAALLVGALHFGVLRLVKTQEDPT